MEFSEILAKRRSIRVFEQKKLDDTLLLELIRAATNAPSAANRQVLRYRIVRTPEKVREVFMLTNWGGHVKPNRNPIPGQTSPAAFIAVCVKKRPDNSLPPWAAEDSGAAIQSMLFAAVNLGFGGCWLGAFDREKVMEILDEKNLTCLSLVAFGYPGETPEREWIEPGNETKYYLDENNLLHVPKYTPESISHFI